MPGARERGPGELRGEELRALGFAGTSLASPSQTLLEYILSEKTKMFLK